MDSLAWWATVNAGHKELDMTEHTCMHIKSGVYSVLCAKRQC